MLPEVDEHLMEKKFEEFRANLPEVGEVESQFYVPPIKMATAAQWAHSRFASSILFSQETTRIPLPVVTG